MHVKSWVKLEAIKSPEERDAHVPHTTPLIASQPSLLRETKQKRNKKELKKKKNEIAREI